MTLSFAPRPAPRYTRFVLVGKKTLWVLAVLLTIIIIVVARINSDDPSSRIVFSGDRPQESAPATADMLKPRYQGLDAENRPYNIIADKAVQQEGDLVALDNLSADMTLADGAWVALNAGTGLYDTNAENIRLASGVSVFYEGGYEFRTQSAFVDVKRTEASGDEPVEGQGPTGTLKANRFKILEKGAILQFHDAVKVTLYL